MRLTSRRSKSKIRIRVPFVKGVYPVGDIIASITTKLGIPPCKGCKKRQARLNDMFIIEGYSERDTKRIIRGLKKRV